MKKLLIALLLLPFGLLAQTELPVPGTYKNVHFPPGPVDFFLYDMSTYQPWASTSAILAAVPQTQRYSGQVFLVGNPIVEYTFASIADVATGTLSVKSGGSGPSYSFANGLTLSGSIAKIGGPLTGNTSIPGAGYTWSQTGLSVHVLSTTNAGIDVTEVRNASGYSLTNVDNNNSDNAAIHLYSGGFSGSTAFDITSNNGVSISTSGDFTLGGGISGGANSASSVVIRNYLLNVSKLFTAKQRFTTNSTNAGINLGTFSGNPSTLVDGDLWYNSAIPSIQARVGGSIVSLGAGGGSGVTSVSGTAPINVSVGTTPVISIDPATTTQPGFLSAADFKKFNNKNGIIGDVYNEDFTGGIGNYTGTGSSVLNYTGGHMVVTGGTAGVNTSKVTRNSLQTSYDKFYRIVRFSVGANVSGETIGIGVSPNSYLNPAFSFYATFNTAATTNRGQIKLHGVQGTDLVKVTSATNLSYTNGDVINFKIVFAGPSTIDILAVNETVPTSNPVHITFAADNNTGSTFFGTATFTTVLYPMGATWTVLSDVFGSTSMLNPTLVRIGDSITQGHGSGSPSQRDANILNQIIPGGVNVFAGGGNVSLDVLNTLPQVIAMKPRYVAMMIGTNDLGNGISLGTVSTSGTYLYNVNQIIKSLIANKIIPIIIYITPTGDPTVATWNAALTTNFGDICSVIDCGAAIATGGLLDAKFTIDGLHLNALGYAYFTDKFIDLTPQLQGAKQFGRYPSISFDGSDLTVDALAGTGNRLAFVNSTGKFSFSNNVKYTDTGISSKPTVIIGGTNGGNVQLDYVAGQSSNIVGSDTGTPQMGISFNSAGTYGGTGRAVGFYDYVTGVFRAGVGSGGDFIVGQSNGTYGVKITQSGDIVMNGILNTSAIAGVVGGVTQYYLAFDNSGNYGGSGRTWSIYDNQGGGYRIGGNSDGDFLVGASGPNYGFKATQSGEVTFKGLTTAFTTRIATYAVTAADHIINCKTNSFSILLPGSAVEGKEYVVYNAGPSTTITLTPNGVHTINGSSSDTVITGAKTVVFDGISNWISF